MPNLIRAGLIFLWMAWIVGVGVAQSDSFILDIVDGTQEYMGNINDPDNDEILVYIEGVKVGDTIYAMAVGSGDVDPYLIMTDSNQTNSLAQDNNGGGGVNAALTFRVQEAGNYLLGMFSVSGTGAYRLVVGVNDPSVVSSRPLDIVASGIGENIGSSDTFVGRRDEVRQFSGAFADDDDEILVVFPALQQGDVIYVYAAGLGFVDTYLTVMDSGLTETFAEDDDSGGGYNSAVSYEVEADGTYTVRLTTRNQIGNYEITAGVNTPEVLDLINAPTTFTLPDGSFDCDSIDQLGTRPNLSGFDRTLEGDAFIIHYTLSGQDATTVEYVDAMAEAIERSLDIQFNDLGWEPPPPDCGEGGDSRLDVYVIDLIDTSGIGIAVPEGVVGDNPATERQEFYATYSFLLVDNDMDYLSGGLALDTMRATVAHEVHHNIQFGYDFNDSFHGFYEAGAVWIESLVYPTTNTVWEYVDDVFSQPDLCIGHEQPSDLREYGEWLMVDSFVRDLGLESYQFIWEYIGTRQGLPGFYDALHELGSRPQEVIERMAVRNLLLDYALAKRFDTTVFIEARINSTGFITPSRNGVQALAVDYIAITGHDRYTFELSGDAALTMFVVGVDMDAETATVFDIGRRGTVDTAQFDHTYIIVLNTTEHSDSDTCEYVDWTIRVFDGSNDELSAKDPETWNASQFIPIR